MCDTVLPIGRATFEFEEFLAACKYDLCCSPETVAFYRRKITRFLKRAQQEKAEVLESVDGNKRTGHAAMETFLILNGAEIEASVEDQERLMLDLAAGRIGRADLTDWLRQHVTPLL